MSLATIGFALFWIIAAVIGVISAVLYYHWIRFGIGILGTITVMVVYAVGTVTLLLSLFGLIITL